MDGLVITISEWCWWPCSNSILVLWTWELTLMSKAWVATSLNTFATSLNLKTLLYPLTWQPPGPVIISGGTPLCHPDHRGPASSHIDVDIDVFSAWCLLQLQLLQCVKSLSCNLFQHLDHSSCQAGAHFVIPTTVDLPPVIAEINRRLAMGLRP